MTTIWGTSRSLPARFEGMNSKALYARFRVRQDALDLLARVEVGQDSQELLAKFELQGAQDLLGRFEAQATTDLLGRFGVNQEAEDLLGKFEAQTTANLLGKANIIHSEDLLGRFEAQATAELLVKFEAQSTRNMLGKTEIKNIDTAELLSKSEIQHSGSAELLGKFDAQIIQDLLARFEVGQDSCELLGKTVIRHDGVPVDLLVRFEAQVILDLLARFEVGQDSAELLGRFEAQATAELLGKFDAQIIQDLLARVEVGQDFSDLLSKAVIIHPAYPVWLFGKFEVGLTNAYRNLGSILELRRLVYSGCVGRVVVRHTGAPAELSGVCLVPYLAVAELLGGGVIRDGGSVELPARFSTQNLGDLYAKFHVPAPLYDSVLVIADDNLAVFLKYVRGMGHGFIGEPSVEDDYSIKVMGENSFKITSNYEAGSYKEVRFGWKYGFVSPTPTAGVYFNPLGEIEIRDTGSHWELV